MEHKIVEKKAFTVVGLKFHGKPKPGEIPQLWNNFVPRIEDIDQIVEGASYGVMGNFEPATGAFDYLAGMEVSSAEKLPEGMASWDLPDGQYAVFTTNLKTLQGDYDTIYQQWLPQSGYAHAGTPDFELYDENFRGGQEDPFYIYVALKQ